MKDINHILEHPYVDNGSYTVPDGYFDTLHDRIMKRIEKESLYAEQANNKPSAKLKISSINPKFKYAVAACLIGVVSLLGAGLFFHYNNEKNVLAKQQQEVIASEQYYNDCMEYAMVDNDDLYSYLTEQ